MIIKSVGRQWPPLLTIELVLWPILPCLQIVLLPIVVVVVVRALFRPTRARACTQHIQSISLIKGTVGGGGGLKGL